MRLLKRLFYVYYAAAAKRTWPAGAAIYGAVLLTGCGELVLLIVLFGIAIAFPPLYQMISLHFAWMNRAISLILLVPGVVYVLIGNRYKGIVQEVESTPQLRVTTRTKILAVLIPITLLAIAIVVTAVGRHKYVG